MVIVFACHPAVTDQRAVGAAVVDKNLTSTTSKKTKSVSGVRKTVSKYQDGRKDYHKKSSCVGRIYNVPQGPVRTTDGSHIRAFMHANKVGTKRIGQIPPCYMCTWIPDLNGNFRLKFVSSLCPEHGYLTRFNNG